MIFHKPPLSFRYFFRAFPLQRGRNKTQLTDYYFWELDQFSAELPYICETHQINIGCIQVTTSRLFFGYFPSKLRFLFPLVQKLNPPGIRSRLLWSGQQDEDGGPVHEVGLPRDRRVVHRGAAGQARAAGGEQQVQEPGRRISTLVPCRGGSWGL